MPKFNIPKCIFGAARPLFFSVIGKFNSFPLDARAQYGYLGGAKQSAFRDGCDESWLENGRREPGGANGVTDRGHSMRVARFFYLPRD